MSTIECLYCSEPFERPNFGLDGPSGVRIGRPPVFCSEACKQAHRRFREARIQSSRIPAPHIEDGEVICYACEQTKSVEEFYRFVDGRLRRPCKDCTRAKRREGYRKRGGIKNVQRDNWARYGVTPEQYAEMHEQQDGMCAICHRPPSKRSLAIDHCHGTGRVRALLCGNCNAILGHAKDDENRLFAAISYLRAHSVDVTKHTT